MEHGRFWSLVDAARSAGGKTSSALVRELAKLAPREIAEADAWLWAYYMAIGREDLWAAVYAIRSGCSDDGFHAFRGWLIGRGEQAVLAAIRDPESLASLIDGAEPRDEPMLSAAQKAYAQVAGVELPEQDELPEIPGRAAWPADRVARGTTWDAAFYSARYPRLFARYIEPELAGRPSATIDEARFWEILDGARGGAAALASALDALSRDELIGFMRWLSAYNRALMRNDLKWACRIVTGKDDAHSVAAFRGWLIAQGREAVHTATHALDALPAPPRPQLRPDVILSAMQAFERRRDYVRLDEDELATIPGREGWAADWEVQRPSPAQLRERFPQLTAGLTDPQLEG